MTTGRINRGQEVSGLKYCLLLSTLPLGSSNDFLRAALLLFLTVELPSQIDELSNNATLPSSSNSVLAVGHVLQPHARCFLGRKRAHWCEIGDVCSQTFIAFKTPHMLSKHRSLHAAAFGTMCDFSPLLGKSTCRC